MADDYDPRDEKQRADVDVEVSEELGPTTISDLRGKTILSLNDGMRIGSIDEVLVDPDSLRIAALVVKQGGLFDRETKIVPAHDVNKWGKDAVLVESRDVFRSEADITDRERWLSASDKLKGLTIVNTEGARLGRMDEILVDNTGKIVAYRVSEGTLGGKSWEIPAQSTKSLGGDVVIVEWDNKG
jgi:uncharacterized protein YrrD